MPPGNGEKKAASAPSKKAAVSCHAGTASAKQSFFFNEYCEGVPRFPGLFVRGKHSAWAPTVKMAAPSRTESGRSPAANAAPTFSGKENQMGRNQTERLTLRLTPEEKTALQERMYKAVAPSMRDFVLKMCMDGQIVVNEDIRELNQELHRQGNNLNQLVRLTHQRRISVVDLAELLKVYRQILLVIGGGNDGDR